MGSSAIRALTLFLALPLLSLGSGCDGQQTTNRWGAKDKTQLESLQSDLAALTNVQTVLEWYTASQGEPSILADTYQLSGDLLNPETVALVDRALARDGISDEERRALEYTRGHISVESIRVKTSLYEDQANNAETTYAAQLSFIEEPVPFRELEPLLSQEKDPARREEIHEKMAEFWKNVLNPVLEKKNVLSTSLAKELGYGSYLELGESYRRAELLPLAKKAKVFLEETDSLYMELFQEQVQSILGKDIKDMRRADINYLSSPPEYSVFFPPELQTAAFEHFLSGIALTLKTASGDYIHIDDSLHPLKESRATAFAIQIPEDIRINLRPVGGLEDYSALFYEGARALHSGWTTSNKWSFQYIGPQATSEGYGEFFNYVWSDPRWLVRYRLFVEDYNLKNGTDYPIFNGDELAKMVRHRVFWDLYFLRRYAYARVVYEFILHGGDEADIRTIYDGPTDDLQEVYRALFSRAYGFELTSTEALRFRSDVDDLLLSLDYARSFLFAHSLHEAVRAQHGYNWYENRKVGMSLKKLWREGTRLSPEEAMASMGQEEMDFKAVGVRLNRLLKEAASLGPGLE